MEDTLDLIEAFVGPPSEDALTRVYETDLAELDAAFTWLGVEAEAHTELLHDWSAFVHDERWVRALAQLVTLVVRDRGDVERAIPIWPDMVERGPHGRHLYYYLFALEGPAMATYLRDHGGPEDLIDETCSLLARHGRIHQAKWGTPGVDAGWWMIPVLRADIVQVGSLEFHLLPLGPRVLAAEPWYDEAEQRRRGPGFRYGDPSLGIHIPAYTDLSPEALDETFTRARASLGTLWPTTQRRLATCESWMMDDRLVTALGPNSRIVQFQQRFTLLPEWHEDRENVLEFVFRQPTVAFEDLQPTSRLQSFLLETLRHGNWRSRVGWLDFDGPQRITDAEV